MKGQIKRVLAILFAVLFVATMTASAVSADDVAKRTASAIDDVVIRTAVGDDDVATLKPSAVSANNTTIALTYSVKDALEEYFNETRGMKLYYRDPIVGPWTDDPDNPCYHVNPHANYRTDFNKVTQNGNFLRVYQ